MRAWLIVCCCLLFSAVLAGCFGVGGQHLNRVYSDVQVSPHIGANRLTIAVADFESTGGEQYSDGVSTFTPWANAGTVMADVVTTKLTGLLSFSVVERSRLKHVLEELKFQMTDLTNPNSLKEVGKLLGADAIVLGRAQGWQWVNKWGYASSLEASFRLVEIETGTVLWSTEGSVVRINSIDDLYGILSQDIMRKLEPKIGNLR